MKIQNINQKIVLGSGSIYRRELLRRLQIPFETANPQIDETPLLNETPAETAKRLAAAKAFAVAEAYPKALIIGSDQVAVLGDMRLGKPLTHMNATKQLQLMRGQEVVFYTGLCLLNSDTRQMQIRVVPCRVRFRTFSDRQIEDYLVREQPYQCAGSAKSEGLGIALIESITGDDPNALIGLPLIALVEMLAHEGVDVI